MNIVSSEEQEKRILTYEGSVAILKAQKKMMDSIYFSSSSL